MAPDHAPPAQGQPRVPFAARPLVVTAPANNETIWIENGERVYPCRCGETHRGPYAVYDYGHHNCLHQSPLVSIDPVLDLICPDCGKSFAVAALTAPANNDAAQVREALGWDAATADPESWGGKRAEARDALDRLAAAEQRAQDAEEAADVLRGEVVEWKIQLERAEAHVTQLREDAEAFNSLLLVTAPKSCQAWVTKLVKARRAATHRTPRAERAEATNTRLREALVVIAGREGSLPDGWTPSEVARAALADTEQETA